MTNKGVYFVANDAIYELAVAFLKSFRIHNPSARLCLIPYDDHVQRLAQLAETYNFSFFADATLFARCADISRCIHGGKVFGHYRKLAAWHGPFDEFVYIDTDTVVTSGVAFVYELLKEHSFVFSNSDFPDTRRWVWRDTIYAAGALTERQIAFAANTGFFCSTKAALSIDAAERMLPGALALLEHMELLCIEQPFLNYLVVTSGKSFNSISNLLVEKCARHYPVEKWGGEKFKLLRMENCCTPQHNVLLVHWAGQWQPTERERRCYDLLRKLGYKGSLPTMRLFMRNRRLWRYYRHQPEYLFLRRYHPGPEPARAPRLMDYARESHPRIRQA